MLDILKSKSVYTNIVLAAVPLAAVCNTALSSLLAAVISLASVITTGVIVSALKNLLTEKIAPFAQLIISAGIVGILSALISLFAKEQISSLGIYIPLITLNTALLLNFDFALESGIKDTLLRGLVTAGAGSALILVSGIIRELLGCGSLFGFDLYSKVITPIDFFKTSAGGLFTLAILSIVYALLVKKEGRV